jgi:hypothetical protein
MDSSWGEARFLESSDEDNGNALDVWMQNGDEEPSWDSMAQSSYTASLVGRGGHGSSTINRNEDDRYFADMIDTSAGDGRKSVTFADKISMPFPADASSLDTAAIFEDDRGSISSGSLNAGISSAVSEEEDEVEEDEDHKLRRGMFYIAGGMGLSVLMGYGFQRFKQVFKKSSTDDIVDEATGDVTHVADALKNNVNETATGTDGGSFYNAAQAVNASANASQSSNTALLAGFGMKGAGAQMSAAQ